MTRVKICGITNRDDAFIAIDSGADALGFIFVPGTPRYVGDIPDVIELLDSLPPFISRVGVCKSPDDIEPGVRNYLDVLQVYDHDSLNRTGCSQRSMPAFRLRSVDDLDQIEQVLAEYMHPDVQLDAYHEHNLGGSGATFDWSIACEVQARFNVRVVLAGGLTPENVAAAIRQVRPYAVDVSSGVENGTPGRKDKNKIEAFFSAVRGAM